MGADVIRLVGLRARGRHGVFDFERAEGQDFVVDVSLYLDTVAAAASDDVADTVDYGRIAVLVRDRIEGEPVNLIETLADRIAADVLTLAGRGQVEVTVHKPQAPIEADFQDVRVTVHRSLPHGAPHRQAVN